MLMPVAVVLHVRLITPAGSGRFGQPPLTRGAAVDHVPPSATCVRSCAELPRGEDSCVAVARPGDRMEPRFSGVCIGSGGGRRDRY